MAMNESDRHETSFDEFYSKGQDAFKKKKYYPALASLNIAKRLGGEILSSGGRLDHKKLANLDAMMEKAKEKLDKEKSKQDAGAKVSFFGRLKRSKQDGDKEPVTKKLSLFLFGIDRAGKTTFVDYVKNEKFMDHAPTLGINVTSIVLGNISFEFNDLGGQQALRPMWMQYWKDPNALVFMVDANDAGRFDQARDALWSVLQRKETRGKPLLVLSNKIDLPNAHRLDTVRTSLAIDRIPDDERDVAVYEISVKNDINLDRPMSFLASIVLEDDDMKQFVSEEVDRLVANLKEIYKAYITEAKGLEKKGKNQEAVDRLYNARLVQLQLFDNGFSKAMKNVRQCTSWIARLQRSA